MIRSVDLTLSTAKTKTETMPKASSARNPGLPNEYMERGLGEMEARPSPLEGGMNQHLMSKYRQFRIR